MLHVAKMRFRGHFLLSHVPHNNNSYTIYCTFLCENTFNYFRSLLNVAARDHKVCFMQPRQKSLPTPHSYTEYKTTQWNKNWDNQIINR